MKHRLHTATTFLLMSGFALHPAVLLSVIFCAAAITPTFGWQPAIDRPAPIPLLPLTSPTFPVPLPDVPLPGLTLPEVPTSISVRFPIDGGHVAIPPGERHSFMAFDIAASTALGKTIAKMQFIIVDGAGERILDVAVCGMGAAASISCGEAPRYTQRIDFGGRRSGAFTLSTQLMDSEDEVVSKVVSFGLMESKLQPVSTFVGKHPRLSPLPAIHFDHYNTSVTDLEAPSSDAELRLQNKYRGERLGRYIGRLGLCLNFMVDPNGHLLGFCGDPTGIWGKNKGIDFDLVLFNAANFNSMDTKKITNVKGPGNNACDAKESKKAPLNLGYFVMDNLGQVIYADQNNNIQFVRAQENDRGKLRLFETRPIPAAAKTIPGMPASFRLTADVHQIAQVMPDYTDGYWFTGTGSSEHAAFVGHIAADETIDFFYPFNQDHGVNELIENGIAMDNTGVYVLTDHALYKFEDTGAGGRLIYLHDYRRATTCKPGTIAHFGSGSTPTLVGDDLVAITDNADGRVNVVVLDRTNDEDSFGREICSVPVFSSGQSANENTLIGYHNSLFVQNWHGAPNKTNGKTDHMTPGLWRIDVASDRSGCSVVWRNDNVGATATARLSTKTGVIYMPIENWAANRLQLAFVDFHTGRETRERMELGRLNINYGPLRDAIADWKNIPSRNQILMMPIYVVPNGRLVQPVYGGMKIISDSEVRINVPRQGITLFPEEDRGGRARNFTAADNDLRSIELDDSASSLQVLSGTWEVCQRRDFLGWCLLVSATTPPSPINLRSFDLNNEISSLRPVTTPRSGITLFRDRGRRGLSHNFTEADRDLSQMRLNDKASSLEVHTGSWDVCRRKDFEDCVVVSTSVDDLRTIGLNDRITSLRPR